MSPRARTRPAARALGGDWELEFRVGAIEAQAIASLTGQDEWAHVLNTYLVTNTNDSGTGSLRQAIASANANAGVDTVAFNLTAGDPNYDIGTGVWTIDVDNPFMVTGPTLIDGWSQSGWVDRPLVELNGASTGGSDDGLVLDAGASEVRGLIINRFGPGGSGNGGTGIVVNANATAIIRGNYIGTDATGNLDRGSSDWGIWLRSNNNMVGGTTAVERNVISGNGIDGIQVDSATGNVIQGNYIGTNAAGTAAIGNSEVGIWLVGANGNTIGGADPGAGNLISGNGFGVNPNLQGVLLTNSDGNLIQGNRIGTNALASAPLPNATAGIEINTGSDNNVLRDNLISGNIQDGVVIWNSTGNVLQANRIGTNAAGTGSIANGDFGVWITGASNNTVGGTAPGQGNVISGNGLAGVEIDGASSGNAVLGNSIYSNGGLGIDLVGVVGVNTNDPGDPDTGPNSLQNYPLLALAVTNGSRIQISGSLNSTANATFRIEFFASTTADPSGRGEGQRYLGFATVTTNGSGNATIDKVEFTATVLVGEYISATATNTITNNTSEFAQNIQATPAREIQGTVFDDVDGDADISPGDPQGTAVFAGATVHLYRDGGDGLANGVDDVLLDTRNTDAFGRYLFSGVLDGTHYVAVDSKTLGPAAIWAEQTYGIAGSALGGTFTPTAGALYGGRNATLSDNALSLATSEHATRVLVAGSSIANVDYGFSFSAIVNERGDATDDDQAINPGTARLQQGSLRQFILNSNALAGVQTANFSIGGGGFQSIALASALPVITDTVSLDAAATQEGFTGTPLIELNGSGVATLNDGFQISASGVTVRGFVINRFLGDGIHLDGSNSVVAGNWIGLDATGTVALGNGSPGVHVLGANNVIGGTGPNDRNVISGNAAEGIRIDGAGATGNFVQGNFIGTDRTGTLDRGNAGDGISIQGSAGGNTIGGSALNARNVIAGNNDDGIEISGSSSGNVIAGNYIGVDVGGAVALGNSAQGIDVSGSNNTIGGTGPNDRNVISANSSHGVMLAGGATGNRVLGNYIGTDLTGTLDRGNADGIRIQTGANANTIGGTSNLERNVISGNEDGIEIRDGGTSLNVILGNYIGTTAGGAGVLGNSESGIEVTSPNNTIGGTVPDAGNRIAFNGEDGVMVTNVTTTGVSILGNVIHSNTGIAIDLADNGPTANDAGDGDTGANNLQNFPALTGAATTGTTVTIAGSLDSTASTNYRIEFFANGVGGPRFLGAGSPTLFVGAAGSATFSYTLTTSVAVGETITATATNLTTSSTSELSAAVTAAAGASISGTLFHDVNGNANITDDGAGAFFANVTGAAALYLDDGDGVIDSGDSFVASVNTNASGQYIFNALASGTYYVAVNSKALAADPAWAEQTYAVVGAANNTAGSSFTVATGALYGGRSAAASDNALGSITTAEHVTKVTLAAANVTDINSGFSFNAITSSRDGDDDGGSSRTVQGSLRQFIQNANVLTGTQTANFSIGGGGPQTINITGSALPTITGPVVLDAAATQEGFTGTPIIELNGAAVSGTNGLTITGGSSTVRGFAINRFSSGIVLSNVGGNVVAGNYLGTDLTGTIDRGNQYGIRITSSNNLIGGSAAADRNVISGNSIDGINASGSNNTIAANWIGVDSSGAVAMRNDEDGIWLNAGTGNTVGGTTAGARNVIAGNGWSGVAVSNGGSGNVIQGNWIGLNAFGATLGNLTDGVRIYDGSGHQVGGTTVGAGNVIVGNALRGVAIDSGPGHSVLGNSMYANGGLGIDLAGVAGNDGAKNGGQANAGMDTPVLQTAALSGATLTLAGYVGAVPASPTFASSRVEFFVSDGAGEGRTYLGFLVTNASSQFGGTLAAGGAVTGDRITATATDATGNTSEFAVELQINSGPVNSVPGPQSAFEETPLAISSISVSDPDNNVGAVALAVLNGSLTVIPAGAALVAGSGTAGVTITGSQTDINLTLASLVYQGNLNYSGPDTLTVTSTDVGGLQDIDAIAITVNAVDDLPQIDSATAPALNENSPFGTAVYNVNEAFTGTDLDRDGQALAYSITGGNTGGAFAIDPVTGAITVANAAALDFETTPVFNLTVQATDGTAPDTAVITVNLVNLNDNVPQIDNATAPALNENATLGTPVYNINEVFTGTDLDRDGQALAYSITGGNTGGAFAIDAATGAITVANAAALDFETTPVFSLTVQATDGTTPDTAVITVNLINLNDNAPQINDATAPALPENSVFGTPVYNVNEAFTGTDLDRDGQGLTYTIAAGNTGSAFAIDPVTGAITVANSAALDFEINPVFTLTINATDGTLNDTAQVIVNLTNLNDNAPQIDDATAAALPENSPFGTAVYNVSEAFTGTDNDRDGQALTYSISGGNTGGAFAIDPVTGAITVANPAVLDFETNPVLTLTVNATDGTLNDTAQVTVNLTNLNDNAPQIDDATAAALNENSPFGTAVYNVNEAFTGTDLDRDGQALAYSITGGNTGGAFAIDPVTGAITVANPAALDFETTPVFSLTVQATDGTTPDTAAVTVNLINLNDNAPQINDATAPALNENSPFGAAVYNVNEAFTGTDLDRDGQALTYTIAAGNTGGAFAIDPATGAITVANSAALDFEVNPVFTLTVNATDGTLNDTAQITINLINLNDNVPQIDDAVAPSLTENSPFGTAVYNVNEAFTGTDIDRDGQALTYSITGGNTGGAFAIDAATGAITVANPAAVDFETTPVFNLTVQATDGTTPDTAVITVNLINAGDNVPQIDDATAPALNENSPFGTPVYNVNEAFTGTDLDPDGDALAYSITGGNTGGAFAIDAVTGAITVANPAALDFETTPVFSLTVQATDGVIPDTAVDHGQPDQPERQRAPDRRRRRPGATGEFALRHRRLQRQRGVHRDRPRPRRPGAHLLDHRREHRRCLRDRCRPPARSRSPTPPPSTSRRRRSST